MLCLVTQSCLTLCDPGDCSPTGSFVPWGFSRQEYWSWLPCPPPGDSLDPGIKPVCYVSCTGSEFFTTSATWEEKYIETRDSGRTELHSSLHKMTESISVITNGIREPRSPCMSKVLLKGLRGLLSSTVTALTRKKKKKMLLVLVCICFIFFSIHINWALSCAKNFSSCWGHRDDKGRPKPLRELSEFIF